MTQTKGRPETIAEIANRHHLKEQDWGMALAEFADELKKMNSEEISNAIFEEPMMIGELQDAYLAAVCEYISNNNNLDAPEWCMNQDRRMKKPYIHNHGIKGLNKMLLAFSPVEFKNRMIFIDREPLRRA